jgi:putative ubiquitin-RnfH superfamily antitoxin RatB of RatAB toxin-antitoxin module
MSKVIQTVDELIESVRFVVAESSAMSMAILNETFPITSVTIFSHSDSEFEILKGLLQQLGKPFNFNNGPRVELYKPIIFGPHQITHLRIRQPDAERPQIGCNDFDTDYAGFKEKYITLHPENLSLITRPEYEMIEFHHPEFNVLAYVVSN